MAASDELVVEEKAVHEEPRRLMTSRLCEAVGPAGLLVLELRRSEWIHWSFHELDDTLLSKARRTKDFPLSSVGLLGGGARQLGV